MQKIWQGATEDFLDRSTGYNYDLGFSLRGSGQNSGDSFERKFETGTGNWDDARS